MKRILSFVLLISILLSTLLGTVHAYEDVPKEMWYTEAVEYVQTRGLMLGIEEDRFQPEGVMSRAMAATVAWRLYGEPVMPPDEPSAIDILNEDWYYQAATWCYLTGVIVGFYLFPGCDTPPPTGYAFKFEGEQDATREQFATALFRLAKYCKYGPSARVELTFTDASQVSSWALEAMQWAVAEGLIEGSADGGALLLAPQRSITRAEAAVMVMRYYEKFRYEGEPKTDFSSTSSLD